MKGSHLVAAPALNFGIGLVASMCAVMMPRLLGALTAKNHGELLFFSPQYFEAAVILSVLVGFVIAILEWGVPRSPSDTFMTTLGIPAILAGALSANQDGAAFQQQRQTRETLADELSRETGIVIEPATSDRSDDRNGPQSLINFFVPTVYAAGNLAPLPSSSGSTQLAVNDRRGFPLESASSPSYEPCNAS